MAAIIVAWYHNNSMMRAPVEEWIKRGIVARTIYIMVAKSSVLSKHELVSKVL